MIIHYKETQDLKKAKIELKCMFFEPTGTYKLHLSIFEQF